MSSPYISTIEEIIKSNLKPKEKTTSLANKLKSDKNSIKQAIDYYQKARVAEKGIIVEAIEYVTIENPKFAAAQKILKISFAFNFYGFLIK